MSKDFKNSIKNSFEDSISVKEKIIDQKIYTALIEAGDVVANSISNGGKLMICGNGGSAADAQHLAAELVVKYKKKRKALPAIALSTALCTLFMLLPLLI